MDGARDSFPGEKHWDRIPKDDEFLQDSVVVEPDVCSEQGCILGQDAAAIKVLS